MKLKWSLLPDECSHMTTVIGASYIDTEVGYVETLDAKLIFR